MKCPRCGHDRKPEDTECAYCGIDFAYVEKKLSQEHVQTQESESPKIKTRCPHCGQKYSVMRQQIGRKTKCKKCGDVFEISDPRSVH
jgi:predicted Zn finger-like uncharacterized protein